MHSCSSTYTGADGQVVSCVMTEGHSGHHYSIEGEKWSDAEELAGTPSSPPSPTRGATRA